MVVVSEVSIFRVWPKNLSKLAVTPTVSTAFAMATVAEPAVTDTPIELKAATLPPAVSTDKAIASSAAHQPLGLLAYNPSLLGQA